MTILKETEGYEPCIIGGLMLPGNDEETGDLYIGVMNIKPDYDPLPGNTIPKTWDNNLISSYEIPIRLPKGYDDPLELWGYDTFVLFEGNINKKGTVPAYFGPNIIFNDFLVFTKNSKTGELLPFHCKNCAKSFIVGLAANQDDWSEEFARKKKNS